MNPFKEDFSKFGDDGERGKSALADHIYLDAVRIAMDTYKNFKHLKIYI